MAFDARSQPEADIALPAPFARLRRFALDGALLAFDRHSGISALCDGPATAGLRQRAPRVVLFGITNRCNFGCSYCSRSPSAESTWTASEAFALLAGLAQRGVLEVAFGGGEPFAFPGFDELVQRLHDETPLAVGLTTNGALLKESRLTRLAGKVSQIRVSLHRGQEATAWRAIRLLAGSAVRFGVNVLVTPQVLSRFEDLMIDLLELGCKDVLLLSYNGPDAELHLDAAQALDLGRRVSALVPVLYPRLEFCLGGCWGDRLGAVPRLQTRAGCGAGADFVTITSDRRVQSCSFHETSFAVRSADDVIDVWRAQRAALAEPAAIRGCTRLPQALLASPSLAQPTARIRIFQGFASNNSGVYSLLGSFRKLETLAEVSGVLKQLVLAQAEWQEAVRGVTEEPPSPLSLLCQAEGLADAAESHDWDTEFSELTVESIGYQIFVHSPCTAVMPSSLAEFIVRRGGRISVEIDHAHHPVVASFAFWEPGSSQPSDEAERQRKQAALRNEIEPRLEAACRADDGEEPSLAPAWRDDQFGITLSVVTPALPQAVRLLRDIAAEHGFRVSLQMFEALLEDGDPLADLR